MVVGMLKVKLLPILLAVAILAGACSSNPGAPGQAAGLKVLATETFIGDIAQNVAGDRIKIDILLPLTVDPHEYQPTPSDMIKVASSQVIIINGLGYETWLQKTLDNTDGKGQVIIAAKGLTPRVDPSGAHADGDPHLWMNPANAIQYVQNIRDGLSQADPTGKDVYARNADAYIARLQDLDQWIKAQINQLPSNKRQLVTNHDALAYFAGAYGFTVVGAVIPGVTSEASPSAQQMAGLIDTIRNSGAPALFLDVGENQNLAQQISAETGVKVVTGLYVETLSAPDGPAPTYIDMLKHDVTLIVSALK